MLNLFFCLLKAEKRGVFKELTEKVLTEIEKKQIIPQINEYFLEKNKDLWIRCENCYKLTNLKSFESTIKICEYCKYHFSLTSLERIKIFIDPGTWYPMKDEDIFSRDTWYSEDDTYQDDIIYYYQIGLTEAVKTGVGKINSIPIAIGFMDFEFMGGSMGSAVGEKITHLIKYAAKKSLPLIIMCASGGARMQEGSSSLMQMAKISSALYYYQSNIDSFYVSILTSPTTGGVTASFGMLGDIIIAEPNSDIAFAGKRVIEGTLNIVVSENSQKAELLFKKGLFDLIIPRYYLKDFISELLKLHVFFTS